MLESFKQSYLAQWSNKGVMKVRFGIEKKMVLTAQQFYNVRTYANFSTR